MKNFILLLTLITSTFSYTQNLQIETNKTAVDFTYYSKSTKGTLQDVNAEININFKDLSQSVISGVADVSTLSTNNKSRDNHLMSSDFFEVEKHPKMKFSSSKIYMENELYFVKGMLTIRGIEHEVIFTMNIDEALVTLATDIYALDYGVAIKKDREHSRVGVLISLKLN
ncbi:MAG: YceI family protein [Crocinitomicaceae bacterium]|nr:YceI family protein [Crocinitomicaceae bacterium]MDG1776069.1 YceI family protein [Crocinitomicaceae bacterium]